MKIEQNIISRDWTVLHKGRKFYVNFTESDGQTLMLCNRGNWEVSEETDDGVEELDSCKKESGRLVEELVSRWVLFAILSSLIYTPQNSLNPYVKVLVVFTIKAPAVFRHQVLGAGLFCSLPYPTILPDLS